MAAPLWALLANATRARVFAVDLAAGRLDEVADFVHTAGRMKPSDLGDAPGGHTERTTPDGGAGGAAFEPRTDRRPKERERFARELAAFLGESVAARRCSGWLLLVSNPLLGELRAHLDHASAEAVRASEPLDLGWLEGPELSRRVLALARTLP
jgi:hypothetical protein